jgi:glycolate oxidase iron-sulfur subunit
MAYGELLDKARADWHRKPSFLLRRLLNWSASRRQRERLRTLLYWLKALNLLKVMTGLARVVRTDTPDLSQLQPLSLKCSLYPAKREPQGKVMLFTGCTGPDFDADTLRAAIKVLTYLGYVVDVPRQQNCCGAMHLHNGDPWTALSLAKENMQAFGDKDIPVLYVASGCGAQLKEYADLPWQTEQEQQQAKDLAQRCQEITQFIAQHELPDAITVSPLNKTVAIYTPCTMRNVLRQPDASLQLLSRIPGIRLHSLPNNPACCGAAGTYMLSQPALAARIRQPHLESLQESEATLLTTTNIGCAMHLANGIRQQGMDITVRHPVTLFAEQMRLQ